jgi:hypothetical protein
MSTRSTLCGRSDRPEQQKRFVERLVLSIQVMTTPCYRLHGIKKKEQHSTLHEQLGKNIRLRGIDKRKIDEIDKNALRNWISDEE